MIVLAGTARIKPEHRDELLEAARRMVAASRAEDGCLSYRYAMDLDDPDLVLFLEEWRDQAAVDAHFSTQHLAEFVDVLARTLDGPPDITRYEVSVRGPL